MKVIVGRLQNFDSLEMRFGPLGTAAKKDREQRLRRCGYSRRQGNWITVSRISAFLKGRTAVAAEVAVAYIPATLFQLLLGQK